MIRHHEARVARHLLLPFVVLALFELCSGCGTEGGTTGGNSSALRTSAPSGAATRSSADLDVCEVLTADAVGEAVGVSIVDTARLFGDGDPRACAYYRGNATTDQGYAVSVITSPDDGMAVFDARCAVDVRPVERGDDACVVGGNDLIVLRGSGYVEVAIGILMVDLPDETAHADAAVAVYDALEPSL